MQTIVFKKLNVEYVNRFFKLIIDKESTLCLDGAK